MMNPREQAYLKHFAVLSVLVFAAIFTCCEKFMPNALHALIFGVAGCYFAVLFIGMAFGVGPLKVLHIHSKEAMSAFERKKQPWERE
ncbi:MAG: hypothetical protein H6955_11020 [Chromatiaceae bacterium]|nr:hypothetical protein [Chromatiaceae bacterium]